MTTPSHDILSDIVTRSAVQLFEAYGVRLEATAPDRDPGPLALCGVIGFTGDVLRGSLVLALGAEVLAASDPVEPRARRDWMAELTNQLLGRIKNQLLPWGAAIHLSTPVVLRGEQLAPLPASAAVGAQPFRAATGAVCVWIDAELAEGATLRDAPIDDGSAAEGTALLF